MGSHSLQEYQKRLYYKVGEKKDGISYLTLFLTVTREESITGAVRVLNVTQPTHISLAYLESGLSFQLHQPHNQTPYCRP